MRFGRPGYGHLRTFNRSYGLPQAAATVDPESQAPYIPPQLAPDRNPATKEL
jgi:hypothetical protein